MEHDKSIEENINKDKTEDTAQDISQKEDNNKNKSKRKLDKKWVILLSLSFLFILLPATLWILSEDIRYAVYELLYSTEYSDLNDAEISKHNVLTIEDDKILNIKNSKDKERLNDYLIYHRASTDEINETYKSIEEGKLRVIEREVKNTSNKNMLYSICVTNYTQSLYSSYTYDQINNYNEKNGLYLSERFIGSFEANESKYTYIFEYNDQGIFKIKPKKDIKLYYTYIDDEARQFTIDQISNSGSKLECPIVKVESFENSSLKITLHETGKVSREGVEYYLSISNYGNRDVEYIDIEMKIKNKDGKRVKETIRLETSFQFVDKLDKNDEISEYIYLPKGEKIESFIVRYGEGDCSKICAIPATNN